VRGAEREVDSAFKAYASSCLGAPSVGFLAMSQYGSLHGALIRANDARSAQQFASSGWRITRGGRVPIQAHYKIAIFDPAMRCKPRARSHLVPGVQRKHITTRPSKKVARQPRPCLCPWQSRGCPWSSSRPSFSRLHLRLDRPSPNWPPLPSARIRVVVSVPSFHCHGRVHRPGSWPLQGAATLQTRELGRPLLWQPALQK